MTDRSACFATPARVRVLLLPLIAVLAGVAGAQTLKLPDVRTVDLPNGLRVLIAEQHSLPLVEAHLRMPAGAAAEPDGREGMATFTAELLTQGTDDRTASEIAEAIDQMGALLSATADRDDLEVRLSVLTRHRQRALALLADLILNANFPEAEVERMRTRLLADLQQTAESPETLADIALWRARFPDHPYGRRLGGSEASLGVITREELRAYHRSRLVPSGSVLALVGDFDTVEMVEELRALFGGWKGESSASAPLRDPLVIPQPAIIDQPGSAPQPSSPVLLIDKPELTQTQIRLAFPGLPRGHEDSPALTVAASILGGGFTSRLLDAIRVERSLSYTASCRHMQEGRAGLLRVATFTKNPSMREAMDVTFEEIRRFREEGPTSQELDHNISFLSGFLARRMQSPSGIAQSLSMAAFYGLPDDYLARRIERFRAVSVDDIRRVTASHFDPNNIAIVLVADAEEVRPGLDGLGTTEEMEFDRLLQ
jgi:zinc protease